jgi:hypothetical protein
LRIGPYAARSSRSSTRGSAPIMTKRTPERVHHLIDRNDKPDIQHHDHAGRGQPPTGPCAGPMEFQKVAELTIRQILCKEHLYHGCRRTTY